MSSSSRTLTPSHEVHCPIQNGEQVLEGYGWQFKVRNVPSDKTLTVGQTATEWVQTIKDPDLAQYFKPGGYFTMTRRPPVLRNAKTGTEFEGTNPIKATAGGWQWSVTALKPEVTTEHCQNTLQTLYEGSSRPQVRFGMKFTHETAIFKAERRLEGGIDYAFRPPSPTYNPSPYGAWAAAEWFRPGLDGPATGPGTDHDEGTE